jgi:NADH:ubiquinone oxidoreductase subunit 6 (subunit J)
VWRRRFVYSALFFLGTLLAGAGWFAELRDYPIDLLSVTIVGHLLQIIGAFGHMMMPETIDDEEDGNKSL